MIRRTVLLLALAGAASAASVIQAGLPAAVIDLDSASADVTVWGVHGDNAGNAIATGDINGDGMDDLVVGAPGANPPGGSDAGKTYVIYGSATLPSTIDLAAVSADLAVLGDDTGDRSGSAVAAGDINGDTVDDLIIGTGYASGPGASPLDCDGNTTPETEGSRCYTGETYVIYGGDSLPAVIDLDSANADLTVYGADANDRSGETVAAGDVNGDDKDDLIIGAWNADGSGSGVSCGAGQVGDRCAAGEAYVIYGGPGLPATIDLATTSAGLTVYGEDNGDNAGSSAGAGDIDGDTVDDLIVGSPKASPLGAGVAYAVYGGTPGVELPAVGGDIDLASVPAGLAVIGSDSGDRLGGSVSTGDIDGDTIKDLILSAKWADGSGIGTDCGGTGDRCQTGETYVIHGAVSWPAEIDLSGTAADLTVYGDDEEDWSGNSVAAGDMDGDGDSDLITAAVFADGPGTGVACGTGQLGDRCYAGEVYLIYGGDSLPASIDLDAVSADVHVLGGEAEDRLGASVASGDVNGDGADDMIVAAPYAEPPGRTNSGEVSVIFGACPDHDADGICDSLDPDDDNDGCTDDREQGTDPELGGERDPNNFWDFFDVPTGTGLTRDGNVTGQDIFAVIARFNASDLGPGDFDRNSDPLSTPNQAVPGQDRANYHPAYDRGPLVGPDVWDLGPADGSITGQEIFAVIAQFGHSCS